ncbi:MAG TPA: CHAT domain-containing protein [Thermoanaerobaculia bacterium]|nr:CHAT domain-containing protein [Thermoanaerobaculia bacterium]
MQTEHSPFPSDETLAAYIDGRLDEETRRSVVQHMAECSECMDVVMAANESQAAISNVAPFRPRFWSSKTFAAAAAAVIAIASLYGVWQYRLNHPTGIAALAAAAPEFRDVDGRLAGFPYRAKRQPKRGPADEDTDNWKLLGVAAQIKEAAEAKPSTDNLHALGVSYLLARHWDEAVDALEKAAESDAGVSDAHQAIEKTSDRRLLNDLSVAYLAVAKRYERPAAIVAAVECAERAWSLQQTPETAWNRALAYEAMKAKDKARAAWNDYLKLDPGSAWSAEASQHLALLSESTTVVKPTSEASICEAPLENRQRAEDELFATWGEKVLADDAAGEMEVLRKLTAIGGALAQCNGEWLVSDTVRAIGALQGESKRSLAEAHVQFTRAFHLYKDRNIEKAAAALAGLSGRFAAAGDPFDRRVTLLEASCAYYRNNYVECDASINGLVERLRTDKRYRALLAHATWIRGTTRASRGLPYEAIDDYNAALAEFKALREQQNIASLETLLASRQEDVGNSDEAWTHRIAALDLAARQQPTTQTLQLWLQAAELALRDGQLAAARSFLDQHLALCTRPEWRDMRVRAFLQRAELETAARQPEAASDDRKRAFALLERVQSKDMQMSVMMSPEYVRARVEEGLDVDLTALASAADYARAHDNHFMLATLLLATAKAHARRGDKAEASRSIEEALAEIEKQLEAAAYIVKREQLLDRRHEIYAQAVELALGLGDREWAFALNERSRGIPQSDFVLTGSESRPTAALRRMLPRGVAVVEFAVLPSRLAIWFVRADRTSFFEREFEPGQLSAAIRRFVGELQSRNELPDDDDLYRLIVEPWIGDAAGVEALVLVPDDELTEVPFAAVHGSGAPLIERFRLTCAPSAARLFKSRRVASGDNLALIAAPRLPEGSGFGDLPSASTEAKRVAGMYEHSELLEAFSATKTRFLSALGDATIVHFGGHALDNPRASGLAALVLPGEGGATSYLYAHEVAALHLDRVRVVVLAACSTSAGSRRRPGSLSNLSRAFITAGASSVIGSLWPVEDQAAARLSIQLHELLRAGRPPASALREVQLASIHRIPPRDWAAFASIGGIDGL